VEARQAIDCTGNAGRSFAAYAAGNAFALRTQAASFNDQPRTLMRIAIGCDHAGFPMKAMLAEEIKRAGHEVVDVGAPDDRPSDYPDFARAVGERVASLRADRGVVVCGSGVGASVAANKVPRVRAALCHDTFSARQGVEDDDLNVLCLGARVIGPELAKEVLLAFLKARFSQAERHVRRLGKIKAIETDAREGLFDEP
jgi:ribose 5-phosphate isomerase B